MKNLYSVVLLTAY